MWGRMAKKLTIQYLNSRLEAGRYYDSSGTGLHIHVRSSGSKSWSQKLRFRGKQIELGLGSYPSVSLAEARELAAKNKKLAASGENPRVARRVPTTIPTFAEVAEIVIRLKQSELSNPKHKAQWRSTLETYAFPLLGHMAVDEITVNDVHLTLEPIWSKKPETAGRVRGRIQSVLDYATVKGHRSGPNPAIWGGNLSVLLPAKLKSNNHHPALQLKDAQRWWHELKRRDGIGAKALMLVTLTGSRSNEVRGTDWSEFELYSEDKAKGAGFYGEWTRPFDRMKARVEHRIPITGPILEALHASKTSSGLVFRSRSGSPISDMTMSALMKRMHAADEIGFVDKVSKRPAVPHGLRSTYRDWVAEHGHSREAAELQLAHKFGGATEHAYYRTDLLEQRAELMNKWHAFLEGTG